MNRLLSNQNLVQNAPFNVLEMECLRREKTACSSLDGSLCIQTDASSLSQDRRIVKTPFADKHVDWNINTSVEEEVFDQVFNNTLDYLETRKRFYLKDCGINAGSSHRLGVRVVSEAASHALFADTMFVHLNDDQLTMFSSDIQIVTAPYFKGDTAGQVFIHLDRCILLIVGTLNFGEIKRGVFSMMSALLSHNNILPLRSSVVVNHSGDTNIIFGSGMIDESKPFGGDTHGWSFSDVFHIEEGCHIAMTQEHIASVTPQPGVLLENVILKHGVPKFNTTSSASYPLTHISDRIKSTSVSHPRNLIFLTCDASGVLPPISNLTSSQAAEQFLHGYTFEQNEAMCKMTEPVPVFSTCYSDCVPLRPKVYGDLLKEKIEKHNCQVWMINTGWCGGTSQDSDRISPELRNRMFNAAMSGELASVPHCVHPTFKFSIPCHVDGVPDELINAWRDTPIQRVKTLYALFANNRKRLGM